MKVKGAVFDADGTLFDSMSVWDGAAEEYLRSIGFEPRENLTERFKNMSMQDSAEFYRDEYGVRLSIGEIIDGVNRLIDGRYKNDTGSGRIFVYAEGNRRTYVYCHRDG